MISSYNEDIAFNISAGWDDTIKFSTANTAFLTQKVKKGIATVTLKSGTVPGTAVINAYSGDISGSLNIPVGDSSLTLVGDPIYALDGKTVSFDINIMGEDLLLKEMKVSWEAIGDPPETLNKIEIDSSVIYPETSTPILSGELIDVTDNTFSTGIYNVKIYFSTDMNVKDILDVTFNTNSGDYLLHLKQ